MKWKDKLEPKPRNWSSSKKWSGRKSGTYKWYEIQDSVAYYSIFDKPKIIYPEIAKDSRFTFDTTGIYPLKTIFSIPISDLYLLGVLNSASVWNYLKEICPVLGDANKGGRLTLQEIYLEKLPIPKASDSEKEIISQLVQKCLNAKGVDCEVWEKEIDDRVAALYGL